MGGKYVVCVGLHFVCPSVEVAVAELNMRMTCISVSLRQFALIVQGMWDRYSVPCFLEGQCDKSVNERGWNFLVIWLPHRDSVSR